MDPAWVAGALLGGWGLMLLAEGGLDLGDAAGGAGPTAAFVAAVVAAPAAAWAVWRARDRAALRSGPALLALAALAGLAVWSALSITWAPAPDLAWLEANRTLLTLAALALAVALGALVRAAPARLAAGLALAAAPALAWGLGTKVAPTLLGGDDDPSRLQAPVGYWNALALVAVIAVPGVLWLAARPNAGGRSVAAAAAALSALLVILLLTYSRGGLLALAVCVALVLWLVPGRAPALAAIVGGVAGAVLPALYGLTARALTAEGLDAAERRDAGVGLGWRLAVGLALAAGVALLVRRALARRAPGRVASRRAVIVGAGALALVAVAGGVVAADRLTGDAAVANDPGRLTSLEANNRLDWWSEAGRGFLEAPAVGVGAGSFPLIHLRERSGDEDRFRVRQPHQLALQALAEGGLIGFLLLAAAVGAVAWAAVRAVRRAADPAVGLPIAIAAAVLVQAQLDWTWTVPVVAMAAAAAGGVVVAAAAPGPATGRRWPAVAAVGLGLAALVMVASALLPWWSQEQVAAGNRAVAEGRAAVADERADEARALNPLSVQPLLLRARAAALRGDRPGVVAAAREATRVQPENPAAWSALALALGADPGARAAWERVLALSPRDVRARAALGRA